MMKPRHLWRGVSFALLAVAFRPLPSVACGMVVARGAERAKAHARRASPRGYPAPRPEGRGFKMVQPDSYGLRPGVVP